MSQIFFPGDIPSWLALLLNYVLSLPIIFHLKLARFNKVRTTSNFFCHFFQSKFNIIISYYYKPAQLQASAVSNRKYGERMIAGHMQSSLSILII